jgi:hypothetical protein
MLHTRINVFGSQGLPDHTPVLEVLEEDANIAKKEGTS